MGKEAKIGLTAITVLLIIFGVVLANRLKTSSQSQPTSNPEKAAPAKTVAEKKGSTAAKRPAAKTPAAGKAAAAKTTVLAARTGKTQSPKSPPPPPAGQWSFASDTSSGKQTAGSTPTAPLMPKYHQPYADSRQQATAMKPWQQNVPSVSGPVGGSRTVDPYRGYSVQVDDEPGMAQQLPRQSNNRVNVLGPPPQPSQRLANGGQGHATTDRYGSRQPATAALPSYGQASQQGYANMTRQVGQYGAQLPRGSRATSDLPPLATSLPRPDGTYDVQPNDNYWAISEKLYGTGAYFKALAEHNRNRVPSEDKLAVGDVIMAPEVTELEETYPALCPRPSRRETVKQRAAMVSTASHYAGGRTYTVEEGDTLYNIARYELGKASRWVEIHELNRTSLGDDFDYLTPGMQLVLPDNVQGERITSRPDAGGGLYYRR